MATKPFTHQEKRAGDLIQFEDWNAMGTELMRLETAKLNKANETIPNDLTANGKVTTKLLTVNQGTTLTGAAQVNAGLTAKSLTVNTTVIATGAVTAKGTLIANQMETGGALTAGTLTVNGDAAFKGDVKTDTLTIAKDATLTGKVTVGTDGARAGLAVAGNLSFRPFVKLNQNFYPLGTAKQVRTLFGRVKADGSVEAGESFTAARQALGQYRITFTLAFEATPIIIVTPLPTTVFIHDVSGLTSPTCHLTAASKTQLDLRCWVMRKQAGRPGENGQELNTPERADMGFSFMVIGWEATS